MALATGFSQKRGQDIPYRESLLFWKNWAKGEKVFRHNGVLTAVQGSTKRPAASCYRT
jgi:hypothetical protein